jgi:RNA-directed DNA polymerase
MMQRQLSSVLDTTKQGSESSSKEWIETSIWTRNMLTALDNGVKGGKWFSLIDKVYSLKTLKIAWEQVQSNKGSAGVDKISIERFEVNEDKYLQELHNALKDGSYIPQPVKRVYIPKAGGKKRPLGIPVVKDRIAQTALKLAIEPIFEKEFLDMSYGFRPNRGCKDALREVDHLLKDEYSWVVDADFKSYFDTIPHNRLMSLLEMRISDQPLLDLIHKYLKQDIVDGLEKWSPVEGTPQGAVLSPLLANIYLHPLDVMLTNLGLKVVRYADDFVILSKTKQEAQMALEKVKQWVSESELVLHPDKTHLGDASIKGQGFEFLGYRFEAGKRFVRKKSIKSFRDKVRAKTKRSRSGSINEIIADLNPMLRGWFEYFKHAYRTTFNSNDGFVRRRLRAILLKRNKKKNCFGRNINAHKQYRNHYFAGLGLFTLHEAWVVACQSR